eukprot:TRINITY_DN18101_c0_g1_i1.p1 TRINITY_DN18101_c0_g1~~TRINITY_DN18101_c0_g1_i1.p1  ORF type:complete len:214 (+),score=53.39 TRINITY_DN18101_c0_g1_i1:469-1110(+)
MPRPLPLGTLKFDPVYIVSQIVTLQSLYYASLAVIVWLLDQLCDIPVKLDQLFSSTAMGVFSFDGAVTIMGHFLTSLIGALYLFLVVERSRKCLDFALTLHAVHLVACAAVGGFPSTVAWWLTFFVGLCCMTLLGEYLCMQRELADIPTLLAQPDTNGTTGTGKGSEEMREKAKKDGQTATPAVGLSGAAGSTTSSSSIVTQQATKKSVQELV